LFVTGIEILAVEIYGKNGRVRAVFVSDFQSRPQAGGTPHEEGERPMSETAIFHQRPSLAVFCTFNSLGDLS
jgi:hypothetical protein